MANGAKDDEADNEGRYRGFDVVSDDGNLGESTSDTKHYVDSSQSELDRMKKTIEEQAETIAQLTEALSKRNNNDETAGNDAKKRKRDELGDAMNLAMVAETYSKDEKIRELNERVKLLENELREQKKSNSTFESSTASGKSAKPPQRLLPQVPNYSNVESLVENLKSSMEKRLTEMDSKMEAMKVSIDEKMHVSENTKTPVNNNTYSAIAAMGTDDVVTQGNAFQSFIEAKNVEMVVEHERHRRENNIIIHGISENGNDSDEQRRASDESYILELFQILGVNLKPSNITRLGKIENNTKNRPVKIVMNTTTDKDQVMSRLPNLKTAEDKYKRISVKDDYTPEERAMIRSMNDKANELNKAENTTEWKIRGTPKNGLRLVKIKVKQITT